MSHFQSVFARARKRNEALESRRYHDLSLTQVWQAQNLAFRQSTARLRLVPHSPACNSGANQSHELHVHARIVGPDESESDPTNLRQFMPVHVRCVTSSQSERTCGASRRASARREGGGADNDITPCCPSPPQPGSPTRPPPLSPGKFKRIIL